MKFLLLTLLLFAFHSVSAGEQPYHYQIDKEFTDLVHEYEQRTKKRFHSDVMFGKTNKTDAGHCSMIHKKGISYNRTITIDKKSWNNLDSCNQRLLFFHEVGHCLMNYDHTVGRFTVMDKIAYTDNISDYECEEYIDELFTKNFNAPLWLMQNK